MVSDFYIRSIPLICLMALIHCDDNDGICVPRVAIFTLLFGSLLIFEFIMNKRMRIITYSSNIFISQIVFVSIFSSFYSLLSSLDVLKDDLFYGKSVEYRSFMVEHKMRIGLSVIFNVVCFALFSINIGRKLIYSVTVLLILHIVMLIMNVRLIKSKFVFVQ